MRRRTLVQCRSCPWRIGSDPSQIPNGYSRELHEALACTIAEPGAVDRSAEVEGPQQPRFEDTLR